MCNYDWRGTLVAAALRFVMLDSLAFYAASQDWQVGLYSSFFLLKMSLNLNFNKLYINGIIK
jgi:hypothetical protein